MPRVFAYAAVAITGANAILLPQVMDNIGYGLAQIMSGSSMKSTSKTETEDLFGSLGGLTGDVMGAVGVDPTLTSSVTGMVDQAGSVGDQLLSGADPASIDYSGIATAGTDLVGTSVSTVNPDLGATISGVSSDVGGATQDLVEGDLGAAIDHTTDAAEKAIPPPKTSATGKTTMEPGSSLSGSEAFAYDANGDLQVVTLA